MVSSTPADRKKTGPWTKLKQDLWYWITIVTAAFSTVIVFVVPENIYPLALIRQILGSLLVLFLPGFTLTKALRLHNALSESSSETVKTIALLCLSICISLAISALITLFLNYIPWGIRTDSVTLSLLGFTVLVSTVAVAREHRAKK